MAHSSKGSSVTVLCRTVETCTACLSRACLWIGSNSTFPCRRDYFDVDGWERIELPAPTSVSDCPKDPNSSFQGNMGSSTSSFPPAPNILRSELEEVHWKFWLLIAGVLLVVLVLAGLGYLVWHYWRKRKNTREENVVDTINLIQL